MRSLLIVLAVLLVPTWAWAGDRDWERGCNASRVTTAVSTGAFVCATAATSTNTPMLNTATCENMDVLFFPDTGGADADAAVADVYICGSRTDASGDGPQDAGWSPTGICWLLENVQLDGNPATNTEAVYGAAAVDLYVDFSGITTDDPRVIVRCNNP